MPGREPVPPTPDATPAAWPGPQRLAFALAAGAAVLEVAIAARWGNARDHLGAVAIGWGSALAMAHGQGDRTASRVPPLERAAAALAWVGLLGLVVARRAAYHPTDRLVPLALGASLAVLATGVRSLPGYRRVFILLAIPFVCPLPSFLQHRLQALGPTAAVAEVLVRLTGLPVERVGLVLRVPHAAVEICEACSPNRFTGQLAALTVLVLCLFPARLHRMALVALAALAAAYAVNAVRVAFLVVVASRAPHRYAFWDGGGRGAPVFAALAVALSGLLWWWILRPRGGRLAPPPA